MVTFSSVGYGDQYPHSMVEMFFAMFLFLFGTLVFVRFLDTFSYLYSMYYVFKVEDQNPKDLIQWIHSLRKFRSSNLPTTLNAQILSYFAHYW